ncbi:MAG TPA: UDP-N-acetylglucosamine 2-epimerase (non-hydrolyzing) [Planctomycetaceae bacterium]|nr:UDP-N-acetylglucosamine 2-epimerase (non-hydrolyzing) [Planctomycetaceae bacterium]HIQ23257.1 UDP-N-acetylglucosamine 2-epimerase (non-hydrolyzing) [Planctomycetota bacterium]
MKEVCPLLVFGTRPEAIKMSPVVLECLRRPGAVRPLVCSVGQHREMLGQVVEYFGIQPDVELDLMEPDQPLAGLTARCLEALDDLLARLQPECVVVQGDTTTAMATALVAFYRRLPVVHIEAGLRTGDVARPFPEELNRRVADMVAALYCAPTRRAAEALLREGVRPEAVHVTGNTVVDALLQTAGQERARAEHWHEKYALLGQRPMVLITAHRRESFGPGLARICQAVCRLAERFPDHVFLYPVHLNPRVYAPVHQLLGQRENVQLIDPVPYPEFVWLMDRARLILTDSGGIQEEAPSLGKPVVVMRDATERPEVVEAGAARLAGTDPDGIVYHTTSLLTDPAQYAACQIDRNPYGDGRSARRIVDLLVRRAWEPGSSGRAGGEG